MYIPPFVCGIIVGIILIIVVEVAIVVADEKKRKDRKGK